MARSGRAAVAMYARSCAAPTARSPPMAKTPCCEAGRVHLPGAAAKLNERGAVRSYSGGTPCGRAAQHTLHGRSMQPHALHSTLVRLVQGGGRRAHLSAVDDGGHRAAPRERQPHLGVLVELDAVKVAPEGLEVRRLLLLHRDTTVSALRHPPYRCAGRPLPRRGAPQAPAASPAAPDLPLGVLVSIPRCFCRLRRSGWQRRAQSISTRCSAPHRRAAAWSAQRSAGGGRVVNIARGAVRRPLGAVPAGGCSVEAPVCGCASCRQSGVTTLARVCVRVRVHATQRIAAQRVGGWGRALLRRGVRRVWKAFQKLSLLTFRNVVTMRISFSISGSFKSAHASLFLRGLASCWRHVRGRRVCGRRGRQGLTSLVTWGAVDATLRAHPRGHERVAASSHHTLWPHLWALASAAFGGV